MSTRFAIVSHAQMLVYNADPISRNRDDVTMLKIDVEAEAPVATLSTYCKLKYTIAYGVNQENFKNSNKYPLSN